ncbi:Plasmodium exported protein (hyp6), unknown, putative [Plasmodium sp.]|nr:Plasmodium exported protein (hyp6), unknown, putative [Plasmodium sp.]
MLFIGTFSELQCNNDNIILLKLSNNEKLNKYLMVKKDNKSHIHKKQNSNMRTNTKTKEKIENNTRNKKETLEDLLEKYNEEMKEINEKSEKPFIKRAYFLLDVFDSIFTDKLVDMKLQKKKSNLVDYVVRNSINMGYAKIAISIPAFIYIIKSFEFFNKF